jgi:hypothetical protein
MQQHTRQVEHQEAPTTAGTAEPLEIAAAEAMLAIVGALAVAEVRANRRDLINTVAET